MIWSKPIIDYRNKIAQIKANVNQWDLIETSCLTHEEREWLEKNLETIIHYIDKKLESTNPLTWELKEKE